jgi:hypothetical protein
MHSFSLRSLIGCAGAVAALLAGSYSGAAAASIDLDTYHVLPDSTSQQVQVFVSDNQATSRVAVSVFVGDNSNDSEIKASKIDNIDLFADSSIFSINNAGYVEIAPISSRNSNAADAQFLPIAPAIPSAPATLDTPISPAPSPVTTEDVAGFPMGAFPTRGLENPASASPARYRASVSGGGAIPGATVGEFSLSSVSGSVSPLPEPATLGLLGILAPAILIRRRRSSSLL